MKPDIEFDNWVLTGLRTGWVRLVISDPPNGTYSSQTSTFTLIPETDLNPMPRLKKDGTPWGKRGPAKGKRGRR